MTVQLDVRGEGAVAKLPASQDVTTREWPTASHSSGGTSKPQLFTVFTAIKSPGLFAAFVFV